MRATTVSCCRTQYPYVENIFDYGLRWRAYAETSKNEDTWWSVLWHCDAEYDTALRVINGQWYGRHAPRTATPTTTCMSGICTGTAAGGTGTTTGWMTTGTPTTPPRCSQLSSFLSGFRWRVLFCKLSVPSAEHFSSLIQL